MVGVTATYETLTSMAAGAVLGVCLLPWTGFGDRVEEKVGPVIWFGLAAVAGLPLVLGVLNRVAARIAHKRRGPDARPLPSPSVGLLARGLLQDAARVVFAGVEPVGDGAGRLAASRRA